MNAYNYNHTRARKARLGQKLGRGGVKFLLVLTLIVAVGLGGYLLWLKLAFGWPFLGLAVVVLMVLIWQRCELARLPAGPSEDINDLLSANCLRLLGKNPTPQSMAGVLHRTRSGHFLAMRFGITPDLLLVAAGQLDEDSAPIFAKAKEIRKQLDAAQVSGGMLAVAILECSPDAEMLLKKMKLEMSDLYAGMSWYNHLHGLVVSLKRRRKDGGIARDLSFGYIPLLQRFGRNISQQQGAYKAQLLQSANQEIVEKMVQIFGGGGRQNVALIGPMGSGRTTIVHAFADKLLDAEGKVPSNLRYRQIFLLDASALVGAASGRGEIETLMMRIMSEAFSAKNIILCLDNAQLFFEDAVGAVDISNLLLPVLEAGRLRLILTMDEQKFLEISAKNSALANTLNKITVQPASEAETMKIMEDQVPQIEHRHKSLITYWALKEAYRLSERYTHDLVQPGSALNLLELAAGHAVDGLVMEESVQKAVEQSKGVKVQASSSTDEREKLLNLEELIHQRMVDQESAVRAVSDALRRAAVNVRNERRPIGTFLFLGPTGVGKTELAKAISEVYFNGEKHIIRLDLNEYVSADDVARLIAEGAKDATSLTAQIMKQPFSVVLLDEIEKAHPQVLTTLLQMLDEGVLRDEKNREVSFRDAIVIATSNAGAERIRTAIEREEKLDELKDALVNELISTGEFKPEFLNRFDEICLFGPLSKENLLRVVDIMLADVNKTLAPQKVSVSLTDEAKLVLVEHGYDPLLGARPMRRIIQKTVENLVAKAMLSGAVDAGSAVEITAEMIEAQLGEAS